MNDKQIKFLQLVTPHALDQQKLFGIPAAITIAQAILESSWGASSLATKANNYFGIKYAHRQGAVDYGEFDAKTWEIEHGQKVVIDAAFQCFPNLQDCFTAHSLLLMRPWYAAAYAARTDWKKFAARLGPKTCSLDQQHCGYSTNPGYAAELALLVLLYHLDDAQALAGYAQGKAPEPQMARIPPIKEATA